MFGANAKALAKTLTLDANKDRQAAITRNVLAVAWGLAARPSLDGHDCKCPPPPKKTAIFINSLNLTQMKTVKYAAFISVFGLVFAANPASAFIAGLDLTGGQSIDTPASGTFGWEFTTNRSLQIDALGIFDSGSPGLSDGSYTLGIWDSSKNLLASTTVSGSGDGISNRFVWKSLASILNIAPGNYVVGASGLYATDRIAYSGTYRTRPGVSWLSDRYNLNGSSLTYPQFVTTNAPAPAVFGGNFSEAAAVPAAVPGPLPLAGAAAALGWSRRLRRRVKAAASQS